MPTKPCGVPGCTHNADRRDRYCPAHRRRLQRTGSLGGSGIASRTPSGIPSLTKRGALCGVADCEGVAMELGRCHRHYQAALREAGR